LWRRSAGGFWLNDGDGNLINRKVHRGHGPSWLQLIVQPLRCRPDEYICGSILLRWLKKNLVLTPLDFEGLTACRDLNDGLAELDHGQMVEGCPEVNNLTAVACLAFNLLSECRCRRRDQRRNHNNKDGPEPFH